MKDILKEFSDIIKEFFIIQDRADQKISEQKIKIVFKDSSILEASEITVHSLRKRKYAFQWMNSNFELKIRWDNALHHK